ncbi:hypothetical protein NQ176_g6619 [Zarea fungicola]|uniref:Uncharacterized protein n=1 Tax=Zarea fungicola TaxID=93591 RepID=A0ACC1N2C5_9HYPO|nr:hypothetical protein NQ176_g6619 [Lecanicillium fungicola]
MPRGSFDDAFLRLLYRRTSSSTSDSLTDNGPPYRNRAFSIRSSNSNKGSGGGSKMPGFSLNSLRGTVQPELSKKLFRLIKSENNLINAYESAGRERISIATQLSEWGEHTGDEAISDVSDKVGVILSEIGEQEDSYAHALDESRGFLKAIRNTEKSVQPSRDGKVKIADDIQRLKLKEPESAKLVVLEQELVRAEAQNLVAEAQLTNITRQKLKEAYEAEFAATIERAEKQIILAKHGRRLLHLLDDTPVVLNDAEDDLRDWQPEPDNYTAEAAGGAVDEEESKAEGEPKEAEGPVSEKEKAPAPA